MSRSFWGKTHSAVVLVKLVLKSGPEEGNGFGALAAQISDSNLGAGLGLLDRGLSLLRRGSLGGDALLGGVCRSHNAWKTNEWSKVKNE